MCFSLKQRGFGLEITPKAGWGKKEKATSKNGSGF
jgi:hypothetical protein